MTDVSGIVRVELEVTALNGEVRREDEVFTGPRPEDSAVVTDAGGQAA